MNKFIKWSVMWRMYKNKKLIVWITAIVLSLAFAVGGAIYVSDYYHADVVAIEAFVADDCVEKHVVSEGVLAYGSVESAAGFIFYPGGKVEYTAYEPLMRALASKGIFCILMEMSFNLAVLDMSAADGMQELYPQIESWYIGGHSLGGSMAASYLAGHAEEFQGLILLGSYSTADLTKADLGVLSVFGSEDKIMNRDKYDKYKANLPSDTTEIEIDGACHAYFGMYGKQDGDGEATLTAEEQIRMTADFIAAFVSEGGN